MDKSLKGKPNSKNKIKKTTKKTCQYQGTKVHTSSLIFKTFVMNMCKKSHSRLFGQLSVPCAFYQDIHFPLSNLQQLLTGSGQTQYLGPTRQKG